MVSRLPEKQTLIPCGGPPSMKVGRTGFQWAERQIVHAFGGVPSSTGKDFYSKTGSFPSAGHFNSHRSKSPKTVNRSSSVEAGLPDFSVRSARSSLHPWKAAGSYGRCPPRPHPYWSRESCGTDGRNIGYGVGKGSISFPTPYLGRFALDAVLAVACRSLCLLLRSPELAALLAFAVSIIT